MDLEKGLHDKVILKLHECLAAVSQRDRVRFSGENGTGSIGRSFDWPLPDGLKVSVSISVTEVGIHRTELDSGKDGSGADGRESAEGDAGGRSDGSASDSEPAETADSGPESELRRLFGGPDPKGDVLQGDSSVREEVRTEE